MAIAADELSTDGNVVRRGDTVYIRIGGCYPESGRWRVSQMTVESVSGSLLRLKRKSDTGCFRKVGDVYVNRSVANGQSRATAGPS